MTAEQICIEIRRLESEKDLHIVYNAVCQKQQELLDNSNKTVVHLPGGASFTIGPLPKRTG